MILKPNQISSARRYSVLLAGVPGIGKSTLALSGPATLAVMTDPGGWDRIPAHCRKAERIEPKDYEEVLSDLVPANLGQFETIAIDTGGSFLNLMKPWVIKQAPKNVQHDGKTLSMQGYGALANEFSRMVVYIREELRKHLVITFHVKEETDNDVNVYRLDMDGKSRNEIWKPMDLGGFMETNGNKRTICFSPSDRFYAKGTHGIEGVIELPNVMKGEPNDFLTTLFVKIATNVQEEAKLGEAYDKIMAGFRNMMDEIKTPDDANAALNLINTTEHVFGSKAESKYLLNNKIKALGFEYVKDKGFEVVSK
jgi:hypothetical protein